MPIEADDVGGGVAVLDDPEAGGVAVEEIEVELDPAGFLADEVAEEKRLAEYDRQSRELIDALEIEVRSAEDHFLALKAQAAEQKKVFEGMEVELRQLIRKRREMRGKKPEASLFDAAADRVPGDGCAIIGGADPLESLWKQYPLERWTAFGLTKKHIEKLPGRVHAAEPVEPRVVEAADGHRRDRQADRREDRGGQPPVLRRVEPGLEGAVRRREGGPP